MSEVAFSLGKILKWASDITGKGLRADRENLIDLVREALEALSSEQSLEDVRKWCIPSCGCLVTIPREMADPIKYRVGDKTGPVRDQFYEFKGTAPKDCPDMKTDLKFQGTSPIFFDLPTQGGRVAARSLNTFAPEATPVLLVQGKDIYGREVFHTHEGKTDVGERVAIAQPSDAPEYSKTIFKEITSVRIIDAELNIQLIWCNAKEYGQTPFEMGLLAFYDPGEEMPCFRRYSFPAMDCSCCYNVEILGNLRIPELRYDNELIRGFSSNAIRNMIRAVYYSTKNDINGATFHSGLARTNIRRNNEKKSKNTDLLDFFAPTSGGSFEGM